MQLHSPNCTSVFDYIHQIVITFTNLHSPVMGRGELGVAHSGALRPQELPVKLNNEQTMNMNNEQTSREESISSMMISMISVWTNTTRNPSETGHIFFSIT